MNIKRIKIKGKCPVCGGKVIIGSWEYFNEPWTRQYVAVCTNEKCEQSEAYDSEIKLRFVNHKTAKVDGLR